jgi:hypothetical protein
VLDGTHIIGELCHFVEIVKMVMPLSRKPVILAVPFHGKAPCTGSVRKLDVSLENKQPDCQQSAIRL